MSVLDLLATYGAAPRTTPALQDWLTTLFTLMEPLAHIEFGTGAYYPTDVQKDSYFAGVTDNGILVWTHSGNGSVVLYFNNAGTWIDGPSTATSIIIPVATIMFNVTVAIASLELLSPEWLICDGRAVSRSTFADLFAAVGTQFGVGDGLSTFNLPDMRANVPAGMDDMGTSAGAANTVTAAAADTVGGTLGAETHTLLTAEIPQHRHTVPAVANLQPGGGGNTVAIGGGGSSINSSYVGSDGAHNNMQPTLFGVYLIKA
jgi:microcystin-dependent protein